MREIKFRAWDKVHQLMYEVFSFDPNHVVVYGLEKYTMPPEREDIVLMQYTGLRDKNGAEIYEGDILEWRCIKEKDNGSLFEVIFKDGCFMSRNIEGYLPEYEPVGKLLLDMDDEIKITVVGNIFENPELLGR